MDQYKKMIKDVMILGNDRDDRTNTGTRSIFGAQHRYDLQKGFPLLTLRKIYWKTVCVEMCWFLRGEPNLDYLHKHNVHIWDPWADDKGELGPVYGVQWRKNGQLEKLLDGLKNNPNSRRHILTAWVPGELDDMALPPCHMTAQFYVRKNKNNQNVLDCQLYQRSADLIVGVPFNIAEYALLVHILCHYANMIPGELIHTFGDLHIYKNHFQYVDTLLKRQNKNLPSVSCDIPEDAKINELSPEMFKLEGYDPHPAIRNIPVAV